jgi:hypothetical protein
MDDFPLSDPESDTTGGSSDLDRGGLPGPRLGAGGGIVDAGNLPSQETLARFDDSRYLGGGDCDESLVLTAAVEGVLWSFSPFFFLVVNVMGLSSEYMTVGFRCLFDTF